MAKSYYRIEYLVEYEAKYNTEPKWFLLYPFDCMQKSFAEGAWAMLKAFYNHRNKHRLLKDGQVVEEMSKQTITVN